MSVPVSPELGTVPTDAAPDPRRRIAWWLVPAVFLGVLVFLALLELVTDAGDLTSSGALRAAQAATVPIMLAGLGGLWAERAGVVNIGLEGMLILGTFGGAYFALEMGAWGGILGGILFGAIGGLLHAVATVIFGVDHIVSGVAINIIALGVVQYLAAVTFAGRDGGSTSQSPGLPDLPALTIDPLVESLGEIEQKDLFLVSELAAVARALTNGLSILVVIAFLLVLLSWFLLWKTSFGLRLRSCGESPAAAESLGINVIRYKMIAVVVSGGLAGLGGTFLVMVASSAYRDGQTGGRGYIGLAAMIFGNWRPGGLIAGSALFGYTETLGLRSGQESVHALLLALAVLALVFAIVQVLRRNLRTAALMTGAAAALALLYFSIDLVPGDFTTMTPYVVTLLVLAFASQRLRMPAADGQIYRKGSAG
ncbi:MAG: nucleoside transporter rane protein [Nocardioides sp.]|nr:nucleoside transporter rane protein [Nocardioides sp.]